MLHTLIGINSPNGPSYLFWSGFGGDLLSALPLAWAVLLWYRHTKCRNCFRLGHHIPHIHYPVCKHHKPEANVFTNEAEADAAVRQVLEGVSHGR